jgi:hypothetical protein
VNAHENIVAGLIEFYSESEIRSQWQQVHASLLQRANETVTITSKTVDGRTTSGVIGATPAEKNAYIAACRDALAQIAETAPPSGRTTLTDYSDSPVLV